MTMERWEPKNRAKVADIKNMLETSEELYPDKEAFQEKDASGIFQSVSFSQVKKDRYALGTGIFSGLNLKNKKIAIVGNYGYNWILSALTVMAGNGTFVPIDNALKEAELENTILATNAPDITDPHYSGNPGDYTIDAILFDPNKENMIRRIIERHQLNIQLIPMSPLEGYGISFDEVKHLGERLIQQGDTSYQDTKIDLDKVAILVATSGTVGKPKIVPLTNRNIVANLNNIDNALGLTPDDLNLNFLPLHHMYGNLMTQLLYMPGASTAFSTSLSYQRDIHVVRPTMLTLVPRALENDMTKIEKRLRFSGSWETFQKLIKAKDLSESELRVKQEILRDINTSLYGGKLKFILSTSAPLSAEIAQFFLDVGINILEAYGLTELITISISDSRLPIPGYAGSPFPGLGPDVKILNPDAEGYGELIASGAAAAGRYYADPERSSAIFKKITNDERTWLHTGDWARIVELDTQYGTLPFVEPPSGRIDDMIVTPGGKKIFPAEIESVLNRHDLIAESLVAYVDRTLVALVVLSQEMMESLEISREEAEAIVHEVIKSINEEILPEYKAIKRISFRNEPFPRAPKGTLEKYKVDVKGYEYKLIYAR